jgi:PAS domain S-box-containing protein
MMNSGTFSAPGLRQQPAKPFGTDGEAAPRLSLAGQAERQTALARLGTRALTHSSLDEVLREGTELVAEALDVDEVLVLELLPTGSGLRPWVGTVRRGRGTALDTPGTPGTVPVGADTLFGATLATDDPLVVSDLHAAGDYVDAARLTTAGVGSAVTVTLSGPSGAFGVLVVLDSAPRRHGGADLSLVGSVAHVLTGAIARRRAEDALRWHSELDQLLTTVSTGFIQFTSVELAAGMTDALGVIGGFVGADRAHMFLHAPDGHHLEVSREWREPGTEPLPERLRTLPDGSASEGGSTALLARLRTGEVVHASATGPDGGPAVLLDASAQWMIALPMRVESNFLGCVVFEGVRSAPRWPEGTAARIRPIGDILAQSVARHRIAAQLEKSELRYRSVVEEVRDVIVQIDAENRITFVNHAWTELTGRSAEETMGGDAMASIYPDDRVVAAEHMASVVMGNDTAVREVRFVAHDGSLRWMEVQGRALRDAAGNLTGLTGTLHDVTERRRAEERALAARAEAERARDEAERARDLAERASRAKSEFLSRMSHELRTPLNAILGFGQLLELSDLPDEESDNVSRIVRAGTHLLDLINDALDISAVESGRFSLSPEPVRFADVVAESLELVRPAATARSIMLHPPKPAERQFHVLADRQRLKQVLVNLLSNAVKYNRDSGTVTLGCESLDAAPAGLVPAEHGWLRLTVTDTGIGIPGGRLDDVFMPFERLGAELTEVEGTGVGLSLAKSLVEAMGGRIGLTSEEGKGTTFHVDMPSAVPAWVDPDNGTVVEAQGAPEASEGARTTHTILYIEDNPSNVMLMQRVMSRRPHVRLMVANDGVTGLELVRNLRPDLVLLDLHLPHLDGAHLLAALRSDSDAQLRETPVVMVTADLTAGTDRRLLDAGASAFLGKPLDVRLLLEVVDRHLA